MQNTGYKSILAGVLALVFLQPACTKAGSTTSKKGGAPTVHIQQKDAHVMKSKKCKPDNLHRAVCMIELMMEDIAANYGAVGGGGITSIKAESSTSYSVSLPQEERVDVLTYDFAIGKDGSISIKHKASSTKNY
jgi:hypothetical protein